MKKLLRKIFFLDTAAQGAFCGVTMMFTVPWLLLTALLFSAGSLTLHFSSGGKNILMIPGLVIAVLVAILALACGVFLLLRFYYVFRLRQQCCRHGTIWLLTAYAAAVSLCCCIYGGQGGFAATLVFAVWIAPLLLIPGLKPVLWLCNALSWTCGLLTILVIYVYTTVDLLMIDKLGGNEYMINPLLERMRDLFGVSGDGWSWFMAAGICFLVIGYLLTGKIFADADKVPFKSLFGKAVSAQWAVSLALYILSAVLALRATKECNEEILALEKHFGRPLTVAALGKLYYQGRTPDPEFWDKVEENTPEFPEYQQTRLDFLSGKSNAELPPGLYTQWRHVFLNNPGVKTWEKLFEQTVPPPQREFDENKLLAGILWPELEKCREFMRTELWRVRFSLEDGDLQQALRACRRMENTADFLKKDPMLTPGLIWIAGERMRMEALAQIISSGLPDDLWLRELARGLEKLENEVQQVQFRAIYGEAVTALNACRTTANATCEIKGRTFVKLSALRWYLPQEWWFVMDNARAMASMYHIKEFSEFQQGPAKHIFAYMLGGVLPNAGAKFRGLIAACRTMQAIIAAELEKRQTGKYPEQMDNLLLDPYSGTALKYRNGQVEIRVDAWNAGTGYFDSEARVIDAVMVWSIGPDGVNEDGKQGKCGDGHRIDDIRAILHKDAFR